MGYLALFNTVTSAPDSPLNGTSMAYVKHALSHHCQRVNPLSAHLCVWFLINTYGLDSANDDKERGRRFADMLGKNYSVVFLF